MRQAEGGRRLERPPHPQPLLTGAANTSATGRRPANPPVLRATGTGWEETPAPHCPGRRRRPCPGRGETEALEVRILQGREAELGAGEGAGRLRRTPSSPGTRASTPQAGPEERDPVPQTSLHGYKQQQPRAGPGAPLQSETLPRCQWVQHQAARAEQEHTGTPLLAPGPMLPGSARPHGWRVTPPDPLPCCRGPSNPHSNPRRQVPISGIYVPSGSTVLPQTTPDIQQEIMRSEKSKENNPLLTNTAIRTRFRDARLLQLPDRKLRNQTK